jgi:hypothetical protein
MGEGRGGFRGQGVPLPDFFVIHLYKQEMGKYTDFVKKNINQMKGKTAPERMKAVASLWREQKKDERGETLDKLEQKGLVAQRKRPNATAKHAPVYQLGGKS